MSITTRQNYNSECGAARSGGAAGGDEASLESAAAVDGAVLPRINSVSGCRQRVGAVGGVRSRYGLSGNALKFLACVFMTLDHVGSEFFPDYLILRILGRIAFPIFAFFVAEGSRYTRNKVAYLLSFAIIGLVCTVFYYAYSGILFANIMLTFTASIILIYALQKFKHDLFTCRPPRVAANGLAFVLLVVLIFRFTVMLELDYGVCGVAVALFTSAFDFRKQNAPAVLSKLERFPVHYACFAAALILLAFRNGAFEVQSWCLLALIPIAFYSGKRSFRPYSSLRAAKVVKYAFYLYYPLHLAVIGLISSLI